MSQEVENIPTNNDVESVTSYHQSPNTSLPPILEVQQWTNKVAGAITPNGSITKSKDAIIYSGTTYNPHSIKEWSDMTNQEFSSQRMEHLEKEFDRKLEHQSQLLDVKIEHLNQKIDSNFDSINQKIDLKFDSINQKIDLKFDSITQKIEDGFKLQKTENEKYFKEELADQKDKITNRLGLYVMAATLVVTAAIPIIQKIF